VLRGQATRERDTDLKIWKYTYGPEARLGRASFYYANSGNDLSFTASPSSADETLDCLTFAQADAELLRRSWSYKAEKDRGWCDAEDIGAIYSRNGVTLAFSNGVLLLPSPHSLESMNAQQKDIDALVQQRLGTTRGTDAYAKLCVNNVSVAYARQD
jgi:hypothetical protein